MSTTGGLLGMILLEAQMRKKLRRLQKRAAPLEDDSRSRMNNLAKVAEHAESFLHSLPSRPVYGAPRGRDESMAAMALSAEPSSLARALEVLEEHVDGIGQNLGSSRFFAYIPSGGLHISALGDYLSSVSNRYSGVGSASPGAARLEETMLRWLADMVGYPDTAGGDLTSGGSIAALSALIAAREAFGISSQKVREHVVYLTSQTHHTFRKALHVAGLGECPSREVPTDGQYRMNSEALQDLIVTDRRSGLTPWVVAATAGTTDIGAVDPLDAIADVSNRENMWCHVDVAYGGAFALCAEGKSRLQGIERSDSLILDPHKGFFLPCGVGTVLLRDGQKLHDAYHARGTYMQDFSHDDERSACDLSPELTRPFRGLRFWLPFKVLGTAPFEAALEEKLWLARYIHDQLRKISGIETGPTPDLSIVTFRYVPEVGSANKFNQQLIRTIQDDGRILLSSTTIDGRFMIRLAVLGYNTHLDAVDVALDVIKETIEKICQG